MEKNQQKVSNPSTPSAKKKTPSKYSNSNVRRSGRLQKLGSPVRSQLAAEKIDLTDNNAVKEMPQAQLIDSGYSVEQVGITPLVHEIDNGDEKHDEELNDIPAQGQVSMEEKIDFLYRTAKELKKSKAFNRPLPSGTTYEDLNYKSLYIDSQKKNEALTKENSKLAKELDYALGKIEAYEKMNDVIGKHKEMIVLTNLGKVSDAVINQSQLMAATPDLALEAHGEKCGADDGGGGAPKPSPQPKAAQSKGTRCSKRKITS